MYKREAKALEGVMRAKRKAGRAKLSSDPYGRVRQQIKQRSSAAYLAAAEAAAAAERTSQQARAELGSDQDESDSDGGLSVEPQKKPPARKRKR